MAVSKNAAGYSGLTEDEEKQLKALLNKAQQAPKASGGSAMTDRKEVPLPKNCTLKEWSHTVCQLPKVNGEPKWNGKTYSELLRMAIDGDIELDKYLGFIFKKYHGSYDGTHKSQAVDLAGTQRNITLSSTESEFVALVSGACEGLLLRAVLQLLLGENVQLKLYGDNTSCMAIAAKEGVCKVKHLSGRLLWIQQRIFHWKPFHRVAFTGLMHISLARACECSPQEAFLLPVVPGQGGVWDLDTVSSSSSPSPYQDAVEEEDIDALQATEDVPEATVLELAAAASRPSASESPVYIHAIACISDHDHDAQQSKLRLSACSKWLSILVLCLHASDVGRHIAALGPLDEHRCEAFDILEAVIGVRSYHTAICRANSILKFLRETLEVFPDTTMPFTEDLVWMHFQRLKSSGGATSAASVLSAFRYAKFVMGFECIDAILNSKRLRGLSDILFVGKRKLLQAQTLTVQQVRILHSVLESANSDKFDRAAAGFLLTALYGRCRVSDLIFLDSIKHDHSDSDGFLELFTAVHKTGRSAAKKATLLPILCPAIGVTGSNWVIHALKAFEQIGLKFEGVIKGPLLRPPNHAGPDLCGRSVNATEEVQVVETDAAEVEPSFCKPELAMDVAGQQPVVDLISESESSESESGESCVASEESSDGQPLSKRLRFKAVDKPDRQRAKECKLSEVALQDLARLGHSLLDACAQMHSTNEIKYLAPERCVSRLHEITQQKTPAKQVEIESDRLIVREKSEVPDEAAHSALQVKEALERRGVGLVFADLTSVSQTVAADKAVWAKLLEEGVKPRRDASGVLPLDASLMKALESYAVSFTLLPLPQQKKPSPVTPVPKPKAGVKTTQFQKTHKGKGKSKGSNKGPRVVTKQQTDHHAGVANIVVQSALQITA
ncbi:unnamed protein product [Cladocopium goreaui]|uniref:Tyr recombinase domain-containing protein n=1 Tax=Cladocopium goreaui TaxID=2562237 RepID=A0A9P1GJ69_9DINO|nr:unnamed protein product [Cladocopium goreaui]